MRRRILPWERLSDEQLLKLRLCDLKLDLRSSRLQAPLTRLYRELANRGIHFRPHVWFAEEWFSPDGVPGFAVPFYLAHPRLTRLEKRYTHEAEGSNRNWLMRILRHEAGHALDSAYRLRRRARWRALFGPASSRYPTQYRARPGSRRHVQHLGEWYAQAHPAEDFAETFAVWLTPRSNWRRRYADWPALRKLQFIAEAAEQMRREPPALRERVLIEPLADNTRTLEQHYRRKLARRLRLRRPLADRLLRRTFASERPVRWPRAAASLLRAHRAELLATVVRRSHADRYGAQQLLRLAIERCEFLELYVRGSSATALQRARATLIRLAKAYATSEGLGWRL
jgi:Putative zinc-binding metallo-peptidase